MESRERESIVLLLDSSPSCENLSSMYSNISTYAAGFGDIDIYDAPNGGVTKYYCRKSRKFVELPASERCRNWSYLFKNRKIIFFGDFDGISNLKEKHKRVRNKVYHFLNSDAYSNGGYYCSRFLGSNISKMSYPEKEIFFKRHSYEKGIRDVSMFICNNTFDFIKCMKKVK